MGSAGGFTTEVEEQPRVRNEGVFLSAKACIVIVEPDDLIRKLLERWLAEAGFGVVAVATHHEMPAVMPRLVITDVSEPDSARIIIEALRAAYAAPILAMSARFRRGLGGSSEPAKRLNVDKVLPKPFRREQLLRAIRSLLNTA
jgi:DNA-binding response OmpR family regulator